MSAGSTRFSLSTGRVSLLPSTGARSWTALLTVQAAVAAWRIVDLVSRVGRPFEARLAWSSSDTRGLPTVLTAPGAARTCVFARALEVEVANLSASANEVEISVADGLVSTENVRVVDGDATNGTTPAPAPPTWARRVRLECADTSALASATLDLRDGQGALRSRIPGNAQSPAGAALGGIEHIDVNCGAAWRLVYLLPF